MSKEAKILIGIAGLVILGGVLLAIFANPQPKEPGAPVDTNSLIRENNHVLGSRDAKVKIVEFADYQCPACKAASPILKRIMDEYSDNPDVALVFKNFPLDSIHPNARIGAEAAEAAGEQGKYWEMYEILYNNQEQWSVNPSPLDLLVSYAQQIGIENIDQFRESVQIRKYNEIISADVSDGQSLGVNSTPTIYVNGNKLDNYQYETIKNAIIAELIGTGESTGESSSASTETTVPAEPVEVPLSTEPQQ